jgi:hypothetical protein
VKLHDERAKKMAIYLKTRNNFKKKKKKEILRVPSYFKIKSS